MKRRRVSPEKAREAVPGGFYAKIEPATPERCCSRCREKSATVRDIDMLCIKCWMEMRAAARGEGSAAPSQSRPF